jgi:hypothetical protein
MKASDPCKIKMLFQIFSPGNRVWLAEEKKRPLDKPARKRYEGFMNNQSIQTAAFFSGNWWWCDFTREVLLPSD